MPVVTFYSADWCPDCRAAKRVLEARGVEYREINIDGDAQAVAVIIAARGKRVIPTLEYRGRFMDGNHFNQEKFERDLDELLAS